MGDSNFKQRCKRLTTFEIVNKVLKWNTRANEYRCAAPDFRVAVNNSAQFFSAHEFNIPNHNLLMKRPAKWIKPQPSKRAQLFVHLHKIKAVPGLNELAVFDTGDGDAVKLGHGSGPFESQTVADVFASD